MQGKCYFFNLSTKTSSCRTSRISLLNWLIVYKFSSFLGENSTVYRGKNIKLEQKSKRVEEFWERLQVNENTAISSRMKVRVSTLLSIPKKIWALVQNYLRAYGSCWQGKRIADQPEQEFWTLTNSPPERTSLKSRGVLVIALRG